jgi:F0F1-type ATP synthase epsilon subunit
MPPELHLRVITPSKEILDEPHVKAFACRTRDMGALEILPGHMPLVGITEPGTIEYMLGEDVKELSLDGGVVHVDHNEVVLLILEAGLRREQAAEGLGRLEMTMLSQEAAQPEGKG